jgi:8-oxo-dGTP pyrophosphatase MutT (NUDIX family)
MKTILEFSDRDLDAAAPARDRSAYKRREAARAVVTDEDGRVALLHVVKYDYYKLPGGGIDAGESVTAALKRELLEEIGCEAEITGEIGQIIEYRDRGDFRQTSYAFTARMVGEQQAPEFTAKELNDEFEMMWAADLEDAIALVAEARPELYEAHHIQLRDLTILKSA